MSDHWSDRYNVDGIAEALQYPTAQAWWDVTEHGDWMEWLLQRHGWPNEVRAEYERVEAQARAEYRRVEAPALAEYERVTAQALAEYDRVTAQALRALVPVCPGQEANDGAE